MKIIIPASGTGERFKAAGYRDFKSLIQVTDTKKVMDYVLTMFPGDNEFFVISSPETYNVMDEYLKTTNVNFKHFKYTGPKLGPVGAVSGTPALSQFINPTDQVIVSYCDFGMEWNFESFLSFIKTNNCDGAIACYYGNHPHLKDEANVYAACKLLDQSDTIYQVIEKHKSDDRLNERWSSGVYYFKSFDLMTDAFNKCIAANDSLNGEFYVSLVYNHIANTSVIKCYDNIPVFYQFGTPKDFEFIRQKINTMEHIKNEESKVDNLVILAAGKGERFMDLQYRAPKPFLPLGSSRIIDHIRDSFRSQCSKITSIGADAHSEYWEDIPDSILIPSNKIGAAYSYITGCSSIIGETLIVPCDLIAKHIDQDFIQKKKTADAIVYLCAPSQYQLDNPKSFTWVSINDNGVADITIKTKVSNDQLVLIGSFWVKENEVLIEYINTLFNIQFTSNGEYYLDNVFKLMVDAGLDVQFVTLDSYFSLGTPGEYEENAYIFRSELV